jgi:hypothetical protein
VEIQELVAQLRSAVESARSMPMSASAVINRAEVLGLVEQIEAGLPVALTQSSLPQAEQDEDLTRARSEAERIIAAAHAEQDRLVSESEVLRRATLESEQVVTEAQTEAAALRRETDEYVDERFANLELSLTRTLEALTRGRTRLHERSDLAQLNASPDVDSPFFADNA